MKDKIVELLEEYAALSDELDVHKVAGKIRHEVRSEEEYKRLGTLQAHQEYELTKKGGNYGRRS